MAAVLPFKPARARETTAVRLSDVCIEFRARQRPPFKAIAPTSFAVPDNAFVAIVGPTGCGKSTLLNAVAGLLRPASGHVEIFGQPLTGLNRDAGYLFQQDAVMPWKTALDNIALALEIHGTTREAALDEASSWLGRVGLSRFANRYPHELSGGQRKRVGLAQTLIRRPKILLMDEPFGPLDAQTRQFMGNLLLDLWAADRKAVLFVTHDLEEAIALSDRVLIMSAGPEARIIGDHRISLARPRDAAEIRTNPQFHDIHRMIWNQLKAEVVKTYGDGTS